MSGSVNERTAPTVEALGQPDEPYAQRQALVDLAAVATELAAKLPRPRREPQRAA